MSWFLSLFLVGAVLTTGNNIPNYEHQTPSAKSPKTISKVREDVSEKFEKTYPFEPNGKIQVSNINGSIYVEAWDRPEVYLQATKVASTKERLKDVTIDIDKSPGRLQVEAEYKPQNYQRGKRYKYNKLYVTFRLKVPRTALLDDIETINGSVTVSNMTNYTAITAVNGSVKASNLRGAAKLSTVNGTIYADFDELSDDSKISLETVNGSVKLNIPSDVNATVKASTVNGSISNEFGLPIRKGKYVGRDLYGRIGSGNVKIKLGSVNGGLSINNKDGGTTNPAVNLLKQKTSDDFDESFDSQMSVIVERVRADVRAEVSRSTSDIARMERQKEKAVMRAERDKKRAKMRAERDKERAKMRAERDKERKKKDLLRHERDKERHKENALRNKINREKFEEIESEVERTEEDLMRASEAVYLNRRSPFIQEKTGSFEVVGTPKVVVDADDCDVTVRGWDKQEVKYVISRMTKTGNRTQELRTKISSNKSQVEIEITDDSPTTAKSNNLLNQVRVEVFVPKKSNLKISSNQEIRLEGVSGNLELFGSEGSVNVRDSKGRLKADYAEGTIRIIGFDGEIETDSVDADIYLEGNFNKINSKSRDGNIYLTLPDRANATLTTNGEIDIEKTQIESVINIEKTNKKTVFIGKGGSKYNFDFTDGRLIVRSQSSLSE